MFLCFHNAIVQNVHESATLSCISPFSVSFYPPLHHNGKVQKKTGGNKAMGNVNTIATVIARSPEFIKHGS